MLKTSLVIAAAALSTSPALAAKPTHYVGQELAVTARVPIAKAQAIALHARAGTITDRELEKEGGGSGLRYSFDILSHGKTYEVGVDARTGKVLENAAEGKNPD